MWVRGCVGGWVHAYVGARVRGCVRVWACACVLFEGTVSREAK